MRAIANIYPPEIWERIIVVRWQQLPAAVEALGEFDATVVGLAVEYLLQREFDPPFNRVKRLPGGGWRSVDLAKSRSRAARAATSAAVRALFQEVKREWRVAESPPEVAPLVVSGSWISLSVRSVREGILH